jgi:hypothetical protein
MTPAEMHMFFTHGLVFLAAIALGPPTYIAMANRDKDYEDPAIPVVSRVGKIYAVVVLLLAVAYFVLQ